MDIPDLSSFMDQSGKIWIDSMVAEKNVGNVRNITLIGGPDLNIIEKFNISSDRMCPFAPLLLMISATASEISSSYGDFDGKNDTDQIPFNGTSEQMPCYKHLYFSRVTKYILCCIAIFCGLIAVIGNLLVLGITHFDKSFKSPVFVALQSLSAVSLVNIIFVYLNFFLDCQVEILLGELACKIKGFCLQFTKMMIPIHLCLLSGLRIFLTISPLKYHSIVTRLFVYRAIACLYMAFVLLEIIMIYFGLTYCRNTGSRDWRNIIMIAITAFMLVLTTIISFVKQKSNKLQSKSHRQQSKVATVVVVAFAMIYCPVAIALEIMYLTCYSDTLVYVLIEWLYQITQFILFAINPIILFLRNDLVKKQILSCCCPTYIKKEPSSSFQKITSRSA